VQTAETFKVIRGILTCWLLLKKLVATSNRLVFYDSSFQPGVATRGICLPVV